MECFTAWNSVGISHSIWDGGNPLEFAFPLLSVQLFLIFGVTWALHFLLKPLKQPRVVSEILGGLLLGPSGLGRNLKFRSTLFPKRGRPVLDTVSSFGLMYVIFLIGVKMDAGLVKRSGTKSIVIGLLGFLLPFSMVLTYCTHSHSLPEGLDDRFVFHFALATSLSITSFAVLVPVLSNLNLLNSELGQIAMSASMTNDGLGWIFIMTYIVLEAGYVSPANSISAAFSIAILVVFIVFIVRPMAIWIAETTPPGKPVNEGYVFVFLFIVLIVGFYGDIIGANSFHGALILGLAIPDGPPLGATLAEKTESIVSGILMPLYYVLVGLNTDVTTINDWHGMVVLILLGLIGKLVGILLPSLYYGIPIRDALSLSLYMNSKGLVEVVTYNLWMSNKLVDHQTYALLILSSIFVTAVVTPIATILYEPSRRYTVYKRRTVQHHKPETELRILTCVHHEARVPGIINLLEAVQGTTSSSIAVYALHLVELVGRAAPVFIPHKLSNGDQQLTHSVAESEHIANAFLLFEKMHRHNVSVHPFTTISPYASMHDEICRLAVEKRAELIILPFHKNSTASGLAELNNGLRTVNKKVLASAPCSVGILVDTFFTSSGVLCKHPNEFAKDVVIFFFGGADDREALACGTLMASHHGVTLTVVRFLPSRSIRDDQVERKLDCRVVEEFRQASKRNERVAYREALVKDMEEIVGVIREMEERSYDLAIVGKRHLSNSVVSEDLAEWTEYPELGVVGDILASSDFEARFSVLVIKQQDEMGLHPHQPSGGGGVGAEVEHPRRREGGLS